MNRIFIDDVGPLLARVHNARPSKSCLLLGPLSLYTPISGSSHHELVWFSSDRVDFVPLPCHSIAQASLLGGVCIDKYPLVEVKGIVEEGIADFVL